MGAIYYPTLSLSPLQGDSVPLLASFLRKNHRDLRLATLNCLDAIFQNYSKTPPTKNSSTPLVEAHGDAYTYAMFYECSYTHACIIVCTAIGGYTVVLFGTCVCCPL